MKTKKKAPATRKPPHIVRATIILRSGLSIVATKDGLDIQKFIESLEELLAKTREAQAQGVELDAFFQTLKSQTKA